LVAAARLAVVIVGQFSSDRFGASRKTCSRIFPSELSALKNAIYDKLFRPTAATGEASRN